MSGWFMERARGGDRAAFGRLVKRHQSAVRLQLRRLTRGDAALADDLAQDTFLQAWTGLSGFRGEARLSTWLYRIAYRRFLMHCRTQDEEQAAPAEDEPAAHTGDPALPLDLERAVARLSPAERAALVHCVALEMTLEEAALLLAVPLGTLKSQLARARHRLQAMLADWKTEMPT